jgi:hypothetical protein
MSKTFLLGKFWDPEMTVDAISKVHGSGVQIYDVYAPFPLHGIEPYLDIKRSRLSVASFIYGALGLACAIALQAGIYGLIWPMNIGGKPALSFPAFVPISFELTVLFAAHGMVLTFLIVARFWPGKKVSLMDSRQTDDVFVIAIDKEKITDEGAMKTLLRETGAYEISEKTIEND